MSGSVPPHPQEGHLAFPAGCNPRFLCSEIGRQNFRWKSRQRQTTSWASLGTRGTSWGPLKAAQARSGVCAPLGHLSRLWVNTPHPRSPLQPEPASKIRQSGALGVPGESSPQPAASPPQGVGVPEFHSGGHTRTVPPVPPVAPQHLPLSAAVGGGKCPAFPWHRAVPGCTHGLSRVSRCLHPARRGCPTSSAALAALPPPPLAIL